ncbi:30S ribosomal protein S5 [Candidatus Fermentibacteria bacterium]|nr:30S ribosomal protein S5 [Candidatus Fermentibacteria bacterium]
MDRLITINRVAKVTKGGRTFGFNAIAAVGDGQGRVGVGLGKAAELPESIKKATEKAKGSMIRIPLADGRTIPHKIVGRFGAGKVLLRPASPGTGIIAGAPVRAIMECAGIKDVLTKSQGSNNSHNVVKAAMAGLNDLVLIDRVSKHRESVVAERQKHG